MQNERKHFYIKNPKAIQLIEGRDLEMYPKPGDFIVAAILNYEEKPLTETRFRELMKKYEVIKKEGDDFF